MIRSLLRVMPCAFVFSMALAGCSTTQTERLYSLNSVDSEKKIDTLMSDRSITIQLVGIPDVIDRPELIVFTGPNQLRLLYSDLWAEPIKSEIDHVLRQNLQAIFPTAFVATDMVRLNKDSVRVLIWIEEMSVKTDGDIRLNALWVVQGSDTKSPMTGKLSLKRQLHGGLNAQQTVLIWSDEYLELSQEIARSIVSQ